MKLLPIFARILAALPALTFIAPAVEIGDPAPPLQIAEWFKGQPVDLAAAKGKQIVVVEFWATWCPPCRASIPLLTELQKKHPSVAIIGITDEDAATVQPFLKQQGDQMDYIVARDDEDKTRAAYMKEFGERAPIPYAFIVDKEGRVAWSGSPLAEFKTTLDEIVAGTFDPAKAKKRTVARQKLDQFIQAVSAGADEAEVAKLGKELEALDEELGGITPGEKFNAAELRRQVRFHHTAREYETAVAAGRPAATLVLLEKQLEEFAPPDFKLEEFKDSLNLNRYVSEYLRAVSGQGDTNRLPELTKKLSTAKLNNPRALDNLAWTILTDERVQIRDPELAARFARLAVDLTESKSVSPLETYARALFDGGKAAEAVNWQQKAIEAAGTNTEARAALEATLKKYQEKTAK